MAFRNCPLCSSGQYALIRTQNGFSIVKCVACNHVYTANPAADTASPFNTQSDITRCKIRHRQIVKIIRNYKTPNNSYPIKVAEIGAGNGHLGYLMSLEPETFNYIGFEPSPDRAAFCREYKLNVTHDFFKESFSAYDAIVLDNVLEHVDNPTQLIGEASRSLTPGGMLIIIVPNRYDIRRFIPSWRRRHYWQPHCHIGYFSYSDLKVLTNSNGLEISAFGINSLPTLSLGWIAKTLLDVVGLRVFGLYTVSIKRK